MAEADKIKIEPLTVSNYALWSARMKQLLVYKELWEGIDPGTMPRKAALAKALIGLNVSPEYVQTVEDLGSAKAVWDYFKEMFKGKSHARIAQLRLDFASLRQKAGEVVANYASRARDIYSELKVIGETPKEEELVYNLVNGLRPEFGFMRTIILTGSQELTLGGVLPMLQQEEDRQRQAGELTSEKETAVAYVAKGKPFQKGYKGSGPKGGYQNNQGSNQGQGQRPQGPCYYCGKPGHIKKDCRKRLADQAAQQMGARQANNQGGSGRSGPSVAFTAFDQKMEGVWVIDSGATQHICGSLEIMSEVRPLDPPEVITVTGDSTVEATHEGRVQLSCLVGDVTSSVTLEDVRYVPGAGVNLFSVRRATTVGADVSFADDTCRIRKGGETFIVAKLVQNLWVIEEKGTDYAFLSKRLETAETWHRRFCHAGYEALAKIADGNLVKGMNVSGAKFRERLETVCEPCLQGKQTRLPFPESESKSKEPCELIHMDVCGPMPVMSTGGSKYFCTFLDDYSKLSVAVPISRKSDVKEIVPDILAKWELKSGKKVVTIRSDRGGEYIDGELQKALRELHITHEMTVPGTPEQNGAAERLNRVLLERTRAVLAESGLSQNLWAEALVTVNYARNRTPVSAHDKTPWEMFMGQVPSVGHMRVFGSTAYVHIPKEKRRKLDPVSEKGVFLGYEPTTKGYRILRDRDGVIVVTRNVVFDEKPRRNGGENEFELELGPEEEVGPEILEPVGAMGGEARSGPDSPDRHRTDTQLSDRERTVNPDTPTRGNNFSVEETSETVQTPSPSRRVTGRTRRKPGEWYKTSAHFVSTQPERGGEADNWEPPYSEEDLLEPGEATGTGAVDTERDSKSPDGLVEPQTYEEALESPQAELWQTAMDEEMRSLMENGTWELEECPVGVKPVPMKWVYKIKRNADGSVERFKARLVAKGFLQRQGIDFEEVYAPVSKQTTVRTLLALCAVEDLELHQLDVKTAFLNGELEEEIYMQQAQGYEEGGTGQVCKLKKAIYGLRQAPRAWYLRLKAEMEKLGWTVSEADPALFFRKESDGTYFSLVYVDDIEMAAPKGSERIEDLKRELKGIFDIRDLGESTYFLGMEIERKRDQGLVKLTQKKLTGEILRRFGMDQARGRSVPLGQETKLTREGEPLDTEEYPYRELIGSLLYLSVCTRPDIAHSVGVLSRFMSNPTTEHWRAATGILKYLAETREFGIVFGNGELDLEGYTDADYAGDIDTRRSTTGYVFTLAGGAICWSSRLQVTVAASTTEAEYMGAASSVKEALWLKKLARELGLDIGQIVIKGDNQGALKLLKHPMSTQKSKHIDIVHHFARERVLRGEVRFEYCSTENMAADFLTKAVNPTKFAKCRSMIGVE